MKPETLRLVTLIIAIVALAVSAGSLVWQIVTWRLTGSFVKVEVRAGYELHLVGLEQSDLPSGLPDEKLVRLKARNKGRIAVNVDSWWFETRDKGFLMTPVQLWWQGAKIPHRLEPGESQDWFVHESGILETTKRSSEDIVGVVALGTGATRHSRKRWGTKDWVTVRVRG